MEPTTLRGVALWIVRDPWGAIGRRWNYKSAIMSSLFRGQLFFLANLPAGPEAAIAALGTETWFRVVTAGFYGALTQAFRKVEPASTGTIAAMIVLPAVAHTLEFLVHWLSGTQELARSIGVSVVFTAVSTSFNVFAMRHGALVVGVNSPSLIDDLRAGPRLVAAFIRAAMRACRTAA